MAAEVKHYVFDLIEKGNGNIIRLDIDAPNFARASCHAQRIWGRAVINSDKRYELINISIPKD